jgi:hypothetical protein
LPDLADVKTQVDRIDANVADIHAKISDIHEVFEGLKVMLPMLNGGGSALPPGLFG